MSFIFDERPSDSPFIQSIWRTNSYGERSFVAPAQSQWEMVITTHSGITQLTVVGPQSSALLTPIPEDASFMGIVFKLGTYMPHLPVKEFVNAGLNMPGASCQSVWLDSMTWQIPNFENADTFVTHLVRAGLIMRDPVVGAVLDDQTPDVSLRSVQRRFLHITGLTHKRIQQIERARQAVSMIEEGQPILDTALELGYADQAHLTRSLKRFIGQTPGELVLQR